MIAPIPIYPSTSSVLHGHERQRRLPCTLAASDDLKPAFLDTVQKDGSPGHDASCSGLTHALNEQELAVNYLSAGCHLLMASSSSDNILDTSSVHAAPSSAEHHIPAESYPSPAFSLWGELLHATPSPELPIPATAHAFPDFLVPAYPSPAPQWCDILQATPLVTALPTAPEPGWDVDYLVTSAFQDPTMDALALQDPLRGLDFMLDIRPLCVTPSTSFVRPEELPPPPISRTLARPSSSPYPMRPSAAPPQAYSRSPSSVSSPRFHNSHGGTPCVSSLPATPSPPADEWACPRCPYVQHNRRKPDLRRHIAIHRDTASARGPRWTCCGVPLSDADKHDVPERVLRERPMVIHEGIAMVGGCTKTFSRKDALQRHLRVRKGVCFGDACADWHSGNRAQEVLR